MISVTLNNGVEMPAFGLGVFQTPPEETRAAVEAALAPATGTSTPPRRTGTSGRSARPRTRSLAWAHPGPYDVRVHPGRALLCSHPFDLRPQGSFGGCLGGDPRLAAPPARQHCDSCAQGHEDHSNGHHGDRHGLRCEAGLGGGTHICRQAAFVPGARTVRATRMRSTASARRRAMMVAIHRAGHGRGRLQC